MALTIASDILASYNLLKGIGPSTWDKILQMIQICVSQDGRFAGSACYTFQ